MLNLNQVKNRGSAKGSITDNDEIVIFNSESLGKAVVILFSTLKATLKAYFDTLYAGGVAKATEVTAASSTTLTVANVSGTIITNYGQGTADVIATLPAAESGLNFVATIGTAQASNKWGFRAGTNDKIYLDGVAGSDNQYVKCTPASGYTITGYTFKNSDGNYDWIFITGVGTWTASST